MDTKNYAVLAAAGFVAGAAVVAIAQAMLKTRTATPQAY
jgi:hypothetical protein